MYAAVIMIQVILRVHPVHLINVEQHQAGQSVADPQTKQTDLDCESACRPLLSTSSITIYYSTSLLMAYFSWALTCSPLNVRSPDWLPSSMQMSGQYSVASNPPQLQVAMAGSSFWSLPVRGTVTPDLVTLQQLDNSKSVSFELAYFLLHYNKW